MSIDEDAGHGFSAARDPVGRIMSLSQLREELAALPGRDSWVESFEDIAWLFQTASPWPGSLDQLEEPLDAALKDAGVPESHLRDASLLARPPR